MLFGWASLDFSPIVTRFGSLTGSIKLNKTFHLQNTDDMIWNVKKVEVSKYTKFNVLMDMSIIYVSLFLSAWLVCQNLTCLQARDP